MVAKDALAEALAVLRGGLGRPGHLTDLDCDAAHLTALHLDLPDESIEYLKACRRSGGQLVEAEETLLRDAR